MNRPSRIPLLVLSLAIVSCLLLSALPAAPKKADATLTAVDVSNLADGQSLVVTNTGGVFTVRPFILLTPGVNPNPTPTPTPTPSNPRSLLFKTEAQKVPLAKDPEAAITSKALAMVYRELAKTARPDPVTHMPAQMPDSATLKAVVSGASDTFLKKPSDKATAWQPVRDLLGTQWTIVDAKSPSLSDYADLLDDAAGGLESAYPAKALSPEMIQLILQIIQIIMKLFNLGFLLIVAL